jgi:hypothetical protein
MYITSELDRHRHNCNIRRYFIVVHEGEAKLIFWARFYNCATLVNTIVRHRSLSIKEVTPVEAETMETIGGVPNLHITDAEKWVNKSGWRNARR